MDQATEHDAAEAMLTAIQARVLGSLMEKQMTTPDYYPLTLNALLSACNQKSSRNPVMNLDNSELGRAINDLRREGLVTANMHGRADRFEQHLSRKLSLNSKERAIVCVLLLRGPQTLNEIRTNTSRMVEFSDHEEVQLVLEGLAEREEPITMLLPRAAGQREARYVQLLSGTPQIDDTPAPQARAEKPSPAQEARIAALEQSVAELHEEVQRLKAQLRGQ